MGACLESARKRQEAVRWEQSEQGAGKGEPASGRDRVRWGLRATVRILVFAQMIWEPLRVLSPEGL